MEPGEAIEIEVVIDGDGDTVPLWETVVELAQELRQASAEDRNVLSEHEDLEQDLQETIFVLNNATMTAVNNRETYSLSSTPCSTCVANIMQLIIIKMA